MNALLLSMVLAADGGVPLVHQKVTQGECTFEFDAPKKLRKDKDRSSNISVTLSGEGFEFFAAQGAALSATPTHVVDLFKTPHTDLFRGATNDGGVQLAVVAEEKASSGMGTESPAGARVQGCAFNCRGPSADEVTAFCKSVRLTVKLPRAKK